MRMHARLAASAAAAALLLSTAPLNAQALQGAVVDAGSGRAVPGVLVVLLDASGRQLARSLSSETGAYLVSAPAPGEYRVRAERVGQRSYLSPALPLARGETREHAIRLVPQPVTLEGIAVVGGERRCEVRPAEGARTATLWEEARKALNATAWAEERTAFRYERTVYTREMDPSLQVKSEERSSATGMGSRPFASLPAAELTQTGFVRQAEDGSTTYYAPDAEVLLSDEFLDGHCFRVQAGQGEDAALVGLAFEPVGGRRRAGIAGTLWLERASAELRRLEYRYVHLRHNVPSDRLGGRVEFERVPGGAWIVRRWWIRMPAVRVEQVNRRLHEGMGVEQREQQVLAGIREQGGEVVSITRPDGSPLRWAARASLVGMVTDSTRAAPLPGATVFVSGTSFSAVTDAQGRFRIDGVPEGEYAVSFHHPRLDTLAALPRPQRVAVDTTGESAVVLGVPAVRVAVAAAPAPAAAAPAAGDSAVRLAGLRASARARGAGLRGFHERAARGNGRFVTAEEIDRRKPIHTAELFRGIPSFEVIGTTVRVRMSGSPAPTGLSAFAMGTGAEAGARQPDLSSTQVGTGGSAITAGSQAEKMREGDRAADCVPAWFLDGAAWQPLNGNLSEIHPGDIEGIEVYPRSALAPAQYRRANNDCGIILIWLKETVY